MFPTGQVDEERIDGRKKKKRSPKSRKSQFMVKSVDEITDEDLENVAYRSKDKIWDKDNVSHFTSFTFGLHLFRDTIRAPESLSSPPHLFRGAHATSADRRLWTPRQCAVVVTVWGSKVSSAARA